MIFLKRYKTYVIRKNIVKDKNDYACTIKYNNIYLKYSFHDDMVDTKYYKNNGLLCYDTRQFIGDIRIYIYKFMKSKQKIYIYFRIQARQDFIKFDIDYGKYTIEEVYNLRSNIINYRRVCYCAIPSCTFIDERLDIPSLCWDIGFKHDYRLSNVEKAKYTCIKKYSFSFDKFFKKLLKL